MQIDLKNSNIDQHSKVEINRLLSEPYNGRSDLEQIWFLMDLVWEEYGCNNKKLNWERINQFYSHPVWLLNGLFIEQDELSMQHRNAISSWIAESGVHSVIDYGGGFGTLARLLAEKNPNCNIEIFEPHPSDLAIDRVKEFGNIKIVDKLSEYDCLVTTDVLEHVPDPLLTLSQMRDAVKSGGYLIIQNNFNPVIKCHLPQTFYLRYSFNFFANKMGLKRFGRLKGSYADIYLKEDYDFDFAKIRKYEAAAKLIMPMFHSLIPILRPIKRMIK